MLKLIFKLLLIIIAFSSCVTNQKEKSIDATKSKVESIYPDLIESGPINGKICPLCKGQLTVVGNVIDNRKEPSKNISVWNRSICGNSFFRNESSICTICWHAYSMAFKQWERASETPASFYKPLSPAILDVPIPNVKDTIGIVVFSQFFNETFSYETVAFWCKYSAIVVEGFSKYASQNDLTIEVFRTSSQPKKVYISIKTKIKPYNNGNY